MEHAFDCKISISGQWSEQSYSWIIHNLDNPTENILCRAKLWLTLLFQNHARAVITAGVYVKSFWNFARRKAMILPRSVQNFETIWQTRKGHGWTEVKEIWIDNVIIVITGAFKGIASAISNCVARSVNLDPNVKLRVCVYSTVPAGGLASWGVRPSIGTMIT